MTETATKVPEYLRDDLLEEIFSMENLVERENRLRGLRRQAKGDGALRDFEEKQKSYQKTIRIAEAAERRRQREEADRKKEERRTASLRMLNRTTFTGLEEHGYANVFCGGWEADEGGIRMSDQMRNIVVACPHPILPVERLKNVQTGREKVTLGYKRDGRWQFQTFKKDLISSASKIVELSNYGILVTSESAKALVKYLADVEAKNEETICLRQSSSKLGYVRGKFLPYDCDQIEFDAETEYAQLFEAIHPEGDYEKWMSAVLEIRKYDRFVVRIMMAAAFASVLLGKLGALPFILDVWGDTEAGKTVAMMLTASIWADPTESKYISDFKTTEVALEARASVLNSLPLLLDDTAKVSKRIKDNFEGFVYDLTSGKGKSRSDKTLGVRQENTWRLSTITTGESPLNGYVTQGGAVNRILEAKADGALFRDPHGTAELTKENFGHAGKAFVDALKEIPDETLREEYGKILNDLSSRAKKSMQKQAMSLGAVLLADRIATDHIFHDDRYIDISDAIQVLNDPDEVSANERCYQFIADEVHMNRNRFDKDNNIEQWGILDDGTVYLYRAALDKICSAGGFSKKAFCEYAVKKGLLTPDGAGNPTKLKRPTPAEKPVRMYWLKLPADTEETEQKPEKEGFIQVTEEDGLPFL